MDKDTLKYLQDLSNRATDNHILGYGSARITITAAEFHALEEAIRILSKKPKEK